VGSAESLGSPAATGLAQQSLGRAEPGLASRAAVATIMPCSAVNILELPVLAQRLRELGDPVRVGVHVPEFSGFGATRCSDTERVPESGTAGTRAVSVPVCWARSARLTRRPFVAITTPPDRGRVPGRGGRSPPGLHRDAVLRVLGNDPSVGAGPGMDLVVVDDCPAHGPPLCRNELRGLPQVRLLIPGIPVVHHHLERLPAGLDDLLDGALGRGEGPEVLQLLMS
jgi:hypothetical protein